MITISLKSLTRDRIVACLLSVAANSQPLINCWKSEDSDSGASLSYLIFRAGCCSSLRELRSWHRALRIAGLAAKQVATTGGKQLQNSHSQQEWNRGKKGNRKLREWKRTETGGHHSMFFLSFMYIIKKINNSIISIVL